MKNKWIFFLAFLLLFSCSGNKNRTEERAKQRVTQFIHLMARDQIGEAEKLCASELVDSGNKELFLSSFDDWQIKDTTTLIINIEEIYFPKDKKNKALVSMTIRSEKNNFTKIVSMPIRYEKGDWYLGA